MSSKSRGTNQFNVEWLEDERLLAQGPSVNQAKCILCHKMFELGNMGVSGLLIHVKGTKHKNNVSAKQSLSTLFFSNNKTKDSTSNITTPAVKNPVDSMLIPLSVTQAEIRWAIKTVISHFSYRSCLD